MPTLQSSAAASRISRASSPSPWRACVCVEELEGEPRHLGRVRLVLVHQLREAQHALAPQVGQVVQRSAVAAPPRVEEHALPQRVVGHHELVEAELVHHLLEDDGAGQDDVGPAGVEPRELRAGLRRRRLHDARATRSSSCSIVRVRLLTERGRVPVARMRRHLGQRRDGARRADADLDVEAAHLAGEGRDAWTARAGDRRRRHPGACACRRRTAASAGSRRASASGTTSTSPRRPTSSSVLPPPMSHSRRRRS